MDKKPQEDAAAAPPAEKFDRRVWDKELYAKRALERMAAIEAGEDPDRVDPEDAVSCTRVFEPRCAQLFEISY